MEEWFDIGLEVFCDTVLVLLVESRIHGPVELLLVNIAERVSDTGGNDFVRHRKGFNQRHQVGTHFSDQLIQSFSDVVKSLRCQVA